MSKKMFFPLVAHICICFGCYVLFRLTWIGPEGGILLQYLPDEMIVVIFIIAFILQILVFLAYFSIGKRINSFSKFAILSIFNVLIANIVNIVVINILGYNILSSLRLFMLFGGVSFYFVYLMSDMNFFVNTTMVFLPVVIIFVGNIYAYFFCKK